MASMLNPVITLILVYIIIGLMLGKRKLTLTVLVTIDTEDIMLKVGTTMLQKRFSWCGSLTGNGFTEKKI
jgi:hypothetical protein